MLPLLLLLACRPGAVETRDACGMRAGELQLTPVSLENDGTTIDQRTWSPECNRALGDWLGVDWASYDTLPEHDAPFDERADLLAAAAAALLFLPYTETPAPVGSALAGWAAESGCEDLANCVPALVTDRIAAVAYSELARSTLIEPEGILYYPVASHPFDRVTVEDYVPGVAAELVREAVDPGGVQHVECWDETGPFCDADGNSGRGAEVAVLEAWRVVVGTASANEQYVWSLNQRSACACINDISTVEPCLLYPRNTCGWLEEPDE